MLYISCPYCGPRDEIEFHAGGEAHRSRPENPDALDDHQWADFLFMRQNEKGTRWERWNHASGCRQWFNLCRHTVTHEILKYETIGMPVGKDTPDGASK